MNSKVRPGPERTLARGKAQGREHAVRGALLAITLIVLTSGAARAQDAEFVRGDVNVDGKLSLSDAVMLRRWLFFEREEVTELPCVDAADFDDEGRTNITDAVALMNSLFLERLGGAPPTAPYPEPGEDPTADDLSCASYDVVPAVQTTDTLRFGDVDASPGQHVEIPVYLTNTEPVEAFQLLVHYDSTLFVPEAQVRESLSFTGSYYESISADGLDENFPDWLASNPEAAPGVLAIGFVPSFFDAGFEVPPGEDRLICTISGDVPDDAPSGSTVVFELTDGEDGRGFGHAGIRTELTYRGEAGYVSGVPRGLPGVLQIVGDQIIFRGDVTQDDVVDLTDAVELLNHLFLGGVSLTCADAADADDDGTINLTDAVRILNTLYFPIISIAPPYPGRGPDPTPDGLPRCAEPTDE